MYKLTFYDLCKDFTLFSKLFRKCTAFVLFFSKVLAKPFKTAYATQGLLYTRKYGSNIICYVMLIFPEENQKQHKKYKIIIFNTVNIIY